MCPVAGAPDGSFHLDNQRNILEQFLVNKNLATGDARSRWTQRPCKILRMPAMINPGVYPTHLIGGMGEPVNQNGFSDHFPIRPTFGSEPPRAYP
jgi:hypothetical protein